MSSEKIGLDWTRDEIVERFAKIIRNSFGPEFWQAPAPEWAVTAAETIWQNVEAIVRDRLETDRADIERLRALALTPAASDESLDVAWAAAEAAMPVGWRIRSLILMGRRWEAVAAEGGRGSGREIYIAHGPTPTAALTKLAARLSESPSEGKTE